jgi:pimeloyl-ACP methyl ester carboxylesterase
MTSLSLELNDVTLDCEVYGPDDGPLALCLHGFPDTRHTFRFLAPHLAAQGYRVVVPAMRGYAPSSISKSSNYQLVALANDANRAHEFLGGDERAVLIGHDWGAAATYPATSAEPARWHRSVALSVPPLMEMGRLFSIFSQLQASWYMFYFQNPMADAVVAIDDFSFIEQLWRQWSPHYDPGEDVRLVRSALERPENLSAALGYYRAMFSSALIDETLTEIQTAMFAPPKVATLYLHGVDDGCILATNLGDITALLASGSKVQFIENAGHFLHLEQPESVHAAIDSFLGV